ncbi:phage prohead protease, HK97 family [Actinobaculum suis]|uniref:Phage prohead protease, HK97 family n=1 Tax=Actinobaculum suis TaxID=1657 RepID=A0A7Z9C8Y4_9ACTO|nr:HK97 family phage prohead protease [Actinobaculum suis]VDG76915.1 phage prohead protease, HK97 family [Actinobaculum suis]
MEIRTYPLQIRSKPEKENSGSGWEFSALAVPWDTPDDIGGGFTETITRDALTPVPSGVKLRLEHETTIGKITRITSEEDGLHIDARISDTAAGRDARTLMQDGALSGLSIGFIPDWDAAEITTHGERTNVIQRGGELFEVSLVSFPAYKDTHITEIRNRKVTPMDTDLQELRAATEENSRAIAKLSDTLTYQEAPALCAFRSFGEYAKALIDGNEEALRTYTGATTGDDKMSRPAWLDRTLEQMHQKMRVTSTFTHATDLPAEGMSVEFPVFGEDTLAVAKQEKEGDTLTYGKITLTTGSAPVCTYGGYAEVSRQVIERSSAIYLSTLLTRQALHYAGVIESATQALVKAVIDLNAGTGVHGSGEKAAPSPLTFEKAFTALTDKDVRSIVIDAVEHFDSETMGRTLDGLLVSKDVLKHLANLDTSAKVLKFTEAAPGDINDGTITARTLTGNLAGIPVVLLPGATGTMAFYNRAAIEVHESPGAPLQLQEEEITRLSKTFAVYGYAVHFAPDPKGIVPVKFGA